ncbi:1,5-anhydro-D-fructose reductase [Labrenzia sp. THAF191b]|uniref:Gfo/Idh/MocA family protein n=1 Tax=unclassified Labrenzia TaxID=2648686 RepID=UPI001268A79B|nr:MULTISPECIES: Gfo/Idh/MocA family oxidoreductase [unclassified Labrenzia]QFT00417.1 1,5-anhydro-D-fructose reductase [Labrenzia sp. THAF191b]QFT06730.1 1,5-anhydro-D-fructose reductase [Labrenzia sp. THAF191a]QFT18274.1 1,5-anhydro-D-fructose reductase [Labrenzia sp. THAF187b]
MTDKLGIGIIGCGTISKTYFDLAPKFNGLEIRACADLNRHAAEERASEYGVRALTVHDLLLADDVDLIVNLTVPDAHYLVSHEILAHGKHVYSEKPLALSIRDGQALADFARKKHLRVGCAPDTFLGGAHQIARKAVDEGLIGEIVGGTCHVMSHGMEHWHPNPDFFFKPGGGPVLDLGPYYIAALLNLIGPVKRVCAMSAMPFKTRTIGSGTRNGEKIDVSTPTTIHAILEFLCGAKVTLTASWDVWAHRHQPMELYGTRGTLFLADPNYFGGDVSLVTEDGTTKPLDDAMHPFGLANVDDNGLPRANYRAAGLADMAQSILSGDDTEFRCSLERALHAVDVMVSILKSAETGTFVEIEHQASRPQALAATEAVKLLV